MLPVADAARAARYFRDVLGFELDFIAGEPPSYARVKKGDRSYGDPVYIRLWQCGRREAAPWRGEIVIHVGRDVDGLHAAYVRRGVDGARAADLAALGSARIRDPRARRARLAFLRIPLACRRSACAAFAGGRGRFLLPELAPCATQLRVGAESRDFRGTGDVGA